MNYRLTAVTPLLVGDGQKLSPIDYMVWRDQVNVLDQRRIFRLLSRGPRLEGYLSQLQRAEKLDFASWGGFAQNYAGRRIPFEHSSSTGYWERTPAEYLHIPTFCSGPEGPFLPASALKGALRTGVVSARWKAGIFAEIAARADRDRLPRRMGELGEGMAFGSAQADPMRTLSAADSKPIHTSAFKIYLIRVANLTQRGESIELAWKQAPRGNVAGRTPEQGAAAFVEMAVPGTAFEGRWHVRPRPGTNADRIFAAVNDHASQLIEVQRVYAESAGLSRVQQSLESLSSQLTAVRERKNACLLNLGWGGGFLSKAAFLDTASEDYRALLRRMPFYERAIRTGIPFPKTRRIVFEGNQPSTLPGWALLEVVSSS